jgi:hypothetical protein
MKKTNHAFVARFVEVMGTDRVIPIKDRLGVSYQAAKNYLYGRFPAAEVLAEIAAETDFSINWLLTGKGAKMISGAKAPAAKAAKTAAKKAAKPAAKKTAKKAPAKAAKPKLKLVKPKKAAPKKAALKVLGKAAKKTATKARPAKAMKVTAAKKKTARR